MAIPKFVRQALKFAETRPVTLSEKLEQVVKHLVSNKKIGHKEGNAKLREIRSREVVELLNDAVHRLQTIPSAERVKHILEITQPLFNAMTLE